MGFLSFSFIDVPDGICLRGGWRLTNLIRKNPLGLGYMAAQAQMQFWFKVVIGCGLIFFAGEVLIIHDWLSLKP